VAVPDRRRHPPGGGVIGLPGRNAAGVILDHLGAAGVLRTLRAADPR
jgi:hypothetical protein